MRVSWRVNYIVIVEIFDIREKRMMKQTLRLVMYTYRKIRNALIITQHIAPSPPSAH